MGDTRPRQEIFNMSESTITVKTFHSPTTPDQFITYTHLNPDSPNTLLFCYGAGGDSRFLRCYTSYLTSHPLLSLICIDRWVQGKASRTGRPLFSELSTITLELLNSLSINRFSIAAHSAGAYQMLDLAGCSPPGRVEHIFPISTHIPAAFTGSKIMESMCTMPEFLFRAVTKLDSGVAPKWVEDIVVGWMGNGEKEEGELVLLPEERKVVMKELEGLRCGDGRFVERERIDYRMGYGRVEGITQEILTGLYRDCLVEVLWFTTDGEVFFGPEPVRKISGEMKARVEVVNVPEATHANIMLRTQVWDAIYAKITASTGTGPHETCTDPNTKS